MAEGWSREGPLARGAMAELWWARRGGVRGVEKRIRADQAGNPAFRALLRIEIEALRRLAAVPEVIRLVDAGEDWLVLEPGAPVGAISGWDEAAALLDRVGRALDATHAAGVVHRDVKLANVLRADRPGGADPGGPAGRGFVLADYGAARIDGWPDPAPGLGSPEGFAPERLAGAPATPATDRYALGVLAWEVVCGSAPFPGRRWDELAAQQRAGLPPFAPRWPVPAGVEERVRALLSAEPAARPRVRWGP